MAFETIGQKTIWNNWGVYGSGGWNMWFMAPYGAWMYCGFSKNNTSEFKKVYIGTDLLDYEIYDWEFDVAAVETPDEKFPNEPYEGYPDGSTNLGCIRSGTHTYLYLMGHDDSAYPAPLPIIRRFKVDDDFAQESLGMKPNDGSSTILDINTVCGIEVIPNTTVFLVTNNRNGNNFTLYAYPYTWNGTGIDPSVVVDLTPYITNNMQARIRGMSLTSDGNLVVFCNTGATATDTIVLKFDGTTLEYQGRTPWLATGQGQHLISTSIWAMLVKSNEVFLYFRGLDSVNYSDRITQVFYDNSTGIPSEGNSNFIIENNLVSFGSEDVVTLKYVAKDGFNNKVIGTNCKFIIDDVLQDDPTSWNTTIGSIQDSANPVGGFFDENGVPLAVHAIAATDANGEALAYYKAMRTGTGTFIDSVNVFCPSDI